MGTIAIKSHEQLLSDVNHFIHSGKKKEEYHFKHISYLIKYANILNDRMGYYLNPKKIVIIATAHDMFKERSLNPKENGNVEWNGHQIPQDLNRYVRTNIDILEEFELGDYFNTDINLHALSAGIWVYKELGIRDPEIIYPIMFHSCPIIAVYENLPVKTQHYVDIIMLADKLSSNYLKINMLNNEVKIDLDLMVFGSNGNELNYTMGLFIARAIGMGKSTETQSMESTDYYFKRLEDINPFISKTLIMKQLGGNKKWAKRMSQALKRR